MRKIVFSILFSCVLFKYFCQDFHFSQNSENPSFFNPAMVSLNDAWERITINQRNQWISGTTKFNTFTISVESAILKKKGYVSPSSYMGLGLILQNDVGGDSKLGYTLIGLQSSAIIPLAKSKKISIGIQASYGNKSVDLSKVQFESQWNENRFDSYILSGEGQNSFNFFDASAGIALTKSALRKSNLKSQSSSYLFSFSASHLNQPSYNFLGVKGDKQFIKYALYINYFKYLKGSKIAIGTHLFSFLQGPHLENQLGFSFRTFLKKSGPQVLKENTYFVDLSFFYRVNETLIPRILFSWKGYRVGFSYDIHTGLIKNNGNKGSLEVFLQANTFKSSLFKRK
ncbi:MAG: PorP/SprF family type IX secretion system membrane protein [Flavobacteriia bacterium]|nr:PorP/SprF family type IX secretion system membrane protein [Flavobacteriia bacterium]